MDKDFDKKIDEFLSLIEEYKFDLKMVKIATKITQLRNALASNNLHNIKCLTNKIRKNTDFEGVPYIEKATKRA